MAREPKKPLGRKKRIPILIPLGILAIGSEAGYGVWRSENNELNLQKIEGAIGSLAATVNTLNDTFVASTEQMISLGTKLDRVTKEKTEVTEELGKSLNETLNHIDTLNRYQVATKARNWAQVHSMTQLLKAILLSNRKRVELLFLTMDASRYEIVMSKLEKGILPVEVLNKFDLNEVLKNVNKHLRSSEFSVALKEEEWRLYYTFPLASAPVETGFRSIRMRIPLRLKTRKIHKFTLVRPTPKWIPCTEPICANTSTETYIRVKMKGLWVINETSAMSSEGHRNLLMGQVSENELQCITVGTVKKCLTFTGDAVIGTDNCIAALAKFNGWQEACEFEASVKVSHEPIEVGSGRFLIHNNHNATLKLRVKRKRSTAEWEEHAIKGFAEVITIPISG